jgi:hypothetical protein
MKINGIISVSAIVIGFAIVIATNVRATQLAGMERAPIYAAGAAQELTCTTSASDASAALEIPSNYWLYCPQEVYVRWGETAPTAAAGDFIIAAGTYFPFSTGHDINYVAVKNVSVSGSCWLIEAR